MNIMAHTIGQVQFWINELRLSGMLLTCSREECFRHRIVVVRRVISLGKLNHVPAKCAYRDRMCRIRAE